MSALTVSQAADLIAAGEIVAFATETVYGLGADATSDAAVTKIFAAKGRPSDHPLIVHVTGKEVVSHFATQVPSFAQKLIDAFWPGPLTVILPRREGVATASAGGQDSIGLRCPAHRQARELLAACAALGVQGVSAPSANKFGKVSPTTAQHVREEFGGSVPVLDGGACEVGIESSIVDCTRGVPILLRPGVLTPAQMEQAMGCRLLLNSEQTIETGCAQDAKKPLKSTTNPRLASQETGSVNSGQAQGVNLSQAQGANLGQAPRASGTLESHYAPRAPLRLMNGKMLQTALDVIGSEKAHIAVYARSLLKTASSQVHIRRMPDDARATAQQLFAVLREFDARGVKLIWVEEPPTGDAWDGVRDRLTRAAHS
jgi:L-threonylcarbamoyladenylate synthase